MNSLRRHFVPLLLLGVLCYGAFFHGLGGYPLWDPDEGRSGVIAKDMVESGNWLTLTHNGEPYYDKPALYFWLVALGSIALGMNEMAVRFPSAAAASLTVALLYFWGCRFGGRRKGLWAAALLATTLEFVALGRFGKMDMLFSFFLTAALLFFFYWREKGAQGKSIGWFYALLALAALAKGPVGIVLPLLIVGVAAALERDWLLLKRMRPLTGAAIVVLVCGAWYLPAALKDWEYIKTFLWDHNVLRFLTAREGLGQAEPIYYFIPVLLGGFLPWSAFLPPALHRLWEERREPSHRARLYLAVWALTILVFFSLSRNKLGTYMLPAFPPLALLTADFLQAVFAGREKRPWRSRWVLYGGLAWLLLLLASFPVSELILKNRYPEYFTGERTIVFAFLFLSAGGWAWYRRRHPWMAGLVCLSFLWFTLWFYGGTARQISEFKSSRSLARIVNGALADRPRVIFIRSESFPFYLSGRAEEVPTPGAARRMLSERAPTVALVKTSHIRPIQDPAEAELFVWKAVPSGLALIANFPRPAAQDLGNPLNR